MPYSPDYSDYLKFKRQQTALAVDRQIAERKKRSVVPFSSYNPNYRILSYPPNIFTPSRLLPQPSPQFPQVTYELILDIDNNPFTGNLSIISGLDFQQNVTTLRVSFINAPNIQNWYNIKLVNNTYNFTGTTVIIENPGGGGGGIVSASNESINFNIKQGELDLSSVIVYTLPTPLTYLDEVILSSF